MDNGGHSVGVRVVSTKDTGEGTRGKTLLKREERAGGMIQFSRDESIRKKRKGRSGPIFYEREKMSKRFFVTFVRIDR